MGGGGGTVPCASPACMQRGRACTWQVAHKPGGNGEQPGQRGLLANRKGGGELCLPCPQRVHKGGGGHAGRVGCSPGREANGRGGVDTVPPTFTQGGGEVSQGGGGTYAGGRRSRPGGGACLQMEREGGCSVCPAP